MQDDSPTRERTERLAYRLWQEAGCPEGQADRFWREAECLIAAAPAIAAPPVAAPPPEDNPPASDPEPVAPVEAGWRQAVARYAAAWWAHPSKPGGR